jgi:N-acetylmuramoyl-L-alanine amidase
VRPISYLIIHASDSDILAHDNIETIRKWHVEERGWSDIGYHYFLDKSGNVHVGRPEEKAGAHCRGFNTKSIGICLSGRSEFTEEQFKALEELCHDIARRHGLSKSDIVGHCELDQAGKTCPNFDVQELVSKWGWH